MARIWWIGIRGPIQLGLAGLIAFMVMTGRTEGSQAAEACGPVAAEITPADSATAAGDDPSCTLADASGGGAPTAGDAPAAAAEAATADTPPAEETTTDGGAATESAPEATASSGTDPATSTTGGSDDAAGVAEAGGVPVDGTAEQPTPGGSTEPGAAEGGAAADDAAAPADAAPPAAADDAPNQDADPATPASARASGDAAVASESQPVTDGGAPAEAASAPENVSVQPDPAAAVGDAPVEGSHADAVAAARPASDVDDAAQVHGDDLALEADAGSSIPGLLLGYSADADLPAPARRAIVSDELAGQLEREAQAAGADWALVLAAARAGDEVAIEDVSPEYLRSLSRLLAGLDRAAGADEIAARLAEGSAFARRTETLARFHRAVGLPSLVAGLERSRERLEQRVLASERILFTEFGRNDVVAGRIDVRVLAALLYLAQSHEGIIVSSLVSGHRLFARPGVLSAHVFGKAVDIAAVDGVPIVNGNARGGVTETAVRELLAMPEEAWPRQLISLYDLGGPSFALSNHADHVHLGY